MIVKVPEKEATDSDVFDDARSGVEDEAWDISHQRQILSPFGSLSFSKGKQYASCR